MEKRVEDLDYSQLAGLRGRTVILQQITVHVCPRCKDQSFIEIPRLGSLTRELTAARALHLKKLRFEFVENEWVIVLEMTPKALKKPRKS
jgi:hypothetical protein